MGFSGYRLLAILLVTARSLTSGAKCTYSVYYFDVESNSPRLREVDTLDCEHGCCGSNRRYQYCCESPNTEKDGIGHTTIVGIVAGIAVVIIVLLVVGVCLYRRGLFRRKDVRSPQTTIPIARSLNNGTRHEDNQRPVQIVSTSTTRQSSAITNQCYDNHRFVNDDNSFQQNQQSKEHNGNIWINQPRTGRGFMNDQPQNMNTNVSAAINGEIKSNQHNTNDNSQQNEALSFDNRVLYHGTDHSTDQRDQGRGKESQERMYYQENQVQRRSQGHRLGSNQELAGRLNPAYESDKPVIAIKRKLFGSQQHIAGNTTEIERHGDRYYNSNNSRLSKYKSEMLLSENHHDGRYPGGHLTGSTHHLFTPNPRERFNEPQMYKSTPNLYAQETSRPKMSLPPDDGSADPGNQYATQTNAYHTQPTHSGFNRREDSPPKNYMSFIPSPPTATITLPQNTKRIPFQVSDSSI